MALRGLLLCIIKCGCESGGIGRRTRLRIWRGNPWGFESPLSHQPAVVSLSIWFFVRGFRYLADRPLCSGFCLRPFDYAQGSASHILGFGSVPLRPGPYSEIRMRRLPSRKGSGASCLMVSIASSIVVLTEAGS
jgi:hypothetical protein